MTLAPIRPIFAAAALAVLISCGHGATTDTENTIFPDNTASSNNNEVQTPIVDSTNTPDNLNTSTLISSTIPTETAPSSLFSTLEILPSHISYSQNKQLQLVAVGYNNEGNLTSATQSVNWRSSNDTLASISATGLVTLKQHAGSVTFTAQHQNLQYDITVDLEKLVGNQTPTPDDQKKVTVYFEKPAHYALAYAYVWSVNSKTLHISHPIGSWPGQEMTPVEGQENWYQFDINEQWFNNQAQINLIFNCGSDECQTWNLWRKKENFPAFYSTHSFLAHPPFDINASDEQTPHSGYENTWAEKTISLELTHAVASDNDGRTFDVSDTLFYEGSVVRVDAQSIKLNQTFERWEGNGALYLVDPTQSSTQLVMIDNAQPITLTAIFKDTDADMYAQYITDTLNTQPSAFLPLSNPSMTAEYTEQTSIKDFTQAIDDYEKQCANCHSSGNFSTPEDWQAKYKDKAGLAKEITGTMPLSSPTSCTGKCAEDIADAILQSEIK